MNTLLCYEGDYSENDILLYIHTGMKEYIKYILSFSKFTKLTLEIDNIKQEDIKINIMTDNLYNNLQFIFDMTDWDELLNMGFDIYKAIKCIKILAKEYNWKCFYIKCENILDNIK